MVINADVILLMDRDTHQMLASSSTRLQQVTEILSQHDFQ